MNKIIVRVPATSANIGPGFDTLGIALSLYNEFIFEKSETFKFINIDEEFANEDNLVIRSALKTYEYFNTNIIKFSLEIKNQIPIARGLGSSATCIVAGIVAAFHLLNKKINKEIVLLLATSIEGHPDNVAPAIYGSLSSSFVTNNKVIMNNYDVSNNLLFYSIIPNEEVKTSIARNVLPKQIDFKDCIFNISRAISIPQNLEKGDIDKLYYALNDKIHEPYRKKLISSYEKYKKFSDENKLPFCISGSGSTMLIISDKEIMKSIIKIKSDEEDIKELRIDKNGVTVEEIYED